jgi:hypothetical protein
MPRQPRLVVLTHLRQGLDPVVHNLAAGLDSLAS